MAPALRLPLAAVGTVGVSVGAVRYPPTVPPRQFVTRQRPRRLPRVFLANASASAKWNPPPRVRCPLPVARCPPRPSHPPCALRGLLGSRVRLTAAQCGASCWLRKHTLSLNTWAAPQFTSQGTNHPRGLPHTGLSSAPCTVRRCSISAGHRRAWQRGGPFPTPTSLRGGVRAQTSPRRSGRGGVRGLGRKRGDGLHSQRVRPHPH